MVHSWDGHSYVKFYINSLIYLLCTSVAIAVVATLLKSVHSKLFGVQLDDFDELGLMQRISQASLKG